MAIIKGTKSSNNTSSPVTEELPPKAEGIAWCGAFSLEAIFIIVGNLLTIVLFATNKKLRVKKSLFLVINMAFADLMFGVVVLPLHIYFTGDYYQLWSVKFYKPLSKFFRINQIVFLQAALISAALISGERFCAICWPLKHRTLTVQTYRIVIFVAWLFTILVSTIFFVLTYLASNRDAIYYLLSYFLLLLFLVCGCNIGIWRTFQLGRIASQQQNRASKNHRLTKTLLFVSVIALLTLLPVIIVHFYVGYETPTHWRTYKIVKLLCFANSLLNPVVYALRIPEFRQALALCCFRRQAVMVR